MSEPEPVDISIHLPDLDNTGVKVDRWGRLTDWADRPGHRGRPACADAGVKKKKDFTPVEEKLLVTWCRAAEAQNVLVGTAVFEQLERLRPSHSWQAYDGKWRRSKRLPPGRPHSIPTNATFPNLSRPGAPERNSRDNADASPGPAYETLRVQTCDGTGEELWYSDFRVEIQKTLLKRLSLDSEDQFLELLEQPWFVNVFSEFRRPLQDRQSEDRLELSRNGQLPRFNQDKSPHAWKVRQTIHAVATTNPRYTDETVQKQLWTDDDHDLRFMVRFVQQVLAADGARTTFWRGDRDQTLDVVSERSFWMMLWLRWLHRPAFASSREMKRLALKKEEWLQYLQSVLDARRVEVEGGRAPITDPAAHQAPDVATFVDEGDNAEMQAGIASPTIQQQLLRVDDEAVLSHRYVPHNREELPGRDPLQQDVPVSPTQNALDVEADTLISAGNQDEAQTARPHPATLSAKTNRWRPKPDLPKGIDPPEYKTSQSRAKLQQKGLLWLSEDGFKAYQKSRDDRLTSWGVSAAHSGTCILVPEEWRRIRPLDLLERMAWDPDMKYERSRLQFSLSDLEVAWARASVWFEAWPEQPRRGVDLDQFLSGAGVDGPVYTQVEGSHLCHHGFCVVPQHLVYEAKSTNASRKRCSVAAREFRAYGLDVPPHCKHHDPPCLMQHAALTTYETIQIQLSVLRLANDIPPLSGPPTRPADHPSGYQTFEYSVPVIATFSNVGINPSHLVKSVGATLQRLSRGQKAPSETMTFRCCFCTGVQRVWRQITAYWSHLKMLHDEIDTQSRLEEITRSAIEYTNWLKARTFDYERSNTSTWLKLQQAQSEAFDWNTVESWRLRQDGAYARVKDGDDANVTEEN